MRRYLLTALVLIGVIALALTGCATSAPASGSAIVVEGAWACLSPMMAGNGAAYMVIRNMGRTDDALIGAASDVAETVELHETTMEGDMAGMHPVEAIPVPAGGSVTLEPGGYHVMLIGLKQELQTGQMITLTLTFEKAGQITVQAEVREE